MKKKIERFAKIDFFSLSQSLDKVETIQSDSISIA